MQSWKADHPLATRARKRELCLYRYVSRMTRTENFISQFFFVVFFWKQLFSTFYVTLFIVSRKYFFGFSKSARTPRYTILDSRLPLVIRSRNADLPFAKRARKRELCLYRYVSRMTRTENFISHLFFVVFLETTFLHVSCYPVHCELKTYFWFFEVCTYPSILRYTILDSRLPPCNAISEGRPPLSNTSSEAGALPL